MCGELTGRGKRRRPCHYPCWSSDQSQSEFLRTERRPNEKIQKTVELLLNDRVANVPLVTQSVPTNWKIQKTVELLLGDRVASVLSMTRTGAR